VQRSRTTTRQAGVVRGAWAAATRRVGLATGAGLLDADQVRSENSCMALLLEAREIERLVADGFGDPQPLFRIETLREGFVRVRMPLPSKGGVRPGNAVSGPALFTAADLAMYALVLAHIGPDLMAVTAQLGIHFLSRGTPGDVLADASLLKLGRKLAVMEVRLSTGDDPTPVAHVTGSYSIPSPRRS